MCSLKSDTGSIGVTTRGKAIGHTADGNLAVASGSSRRHGRESVPLPVNVVGVCDRRMLDNLA